MKKNRVREKLLAIILFLGVAVVTFSMRLETVFYLPQLMLVLFGTAVFYLSGNGFRREKLLTGEVGRCALLVGILESMVMIISAFQEISPESNLIEVAAGNLRPVLYGFCIWMACTGRKEEPSSKEHKSAQDYYYIFPEKGLTRRETEIAVLAVKGMTNAEIGYELGIAETTVKKHMSNIFEKLHISSREELKQQETGTY